MRGQCSICTELFESSADIAAIPCGHTFHFDCVSRWLPQSRTCPQCRKPVNQKHMIPKLFFVEPDQEDDGGDPSKLKNDLETLKVNLKQKEKERKSLVTQQEDLKRRIDEMQENHKSMDALYKQERSINSSLKREISFHKKLQTEAELAKKESTLLREKLKDLKAVESMIKGSEDDIQQMMNSQQDSRQLALWCTVLKKELAAKRQECRQIRERHDILKKEGAVKAKALAERTSELSAAQEQIRLNTEDLKRCDSDINGLRQKLEFIMASPRNAKDALARRLVNESPAPLNPPAKRPRLTSPQHDFSDLDLDISADLFPDSPAAVKDRVQPTPKPQPDGKERCETKYIRITSAATTAAAAAAGSESGVDRRRSAEVVTDVSALTGMNIFRKRGWSAVSGEDSSAIRKGYNGLGGHGKFIQNKGFKAPPKKAMASKSLVRPANMSNNKMPPLPTLGGFMPVD